MGPLCTVYSLKLILQYQQSSFIAVSFACVLSASPIVTWVKIQSSVPWVLSWNFSVKHLILIIFLDGGMRHQCNKSSCVWDSDVRAQSRK